MLNALANLKILSTRVFLSPRSTIPIKFVETRGDMDGCRIANDLQTEAGTLIDKGMTRKSEVIYEG